MRRKVKNTEVHKTERYYQVPSEKVQEWSDAIETLKHEKEELKNEMEYKAKAFDEIVNELHYQLQNLESWDTLDQKDCQTLKQILEENIEEGE